MIESNIPKVVKFTSQSTPSQNRVGNHLLQQEEENVTRTLCVRNVCHNSSHLQVKASESSIRQSKRTTIVAHTTACFGQNNMLTEDVHPSDVSTVAMESVTPL